MAGDFSGTTPIRRGNKQILESAQPRRLRQRL
jgi:hypothetical protein